jgi:hypothetical protein
LIKELFGGKNFFLNLFFFKIYKINFDFKGETSQIRVAKDIMKSTTSGVHWYGNSNCLVPNSFVNILDIEGNKQKISIKQNFKI